MADIKKTVAVTAALTGVLAIGVSIMSNKAVTAQGETEKCYGIVKAGYNDCAANGHGCTGHSTVSAHPNEWIKLPKGTCNKIVDGVLK